jgi:acyl-CoA synthetase (AMP-forming)/AMP-acid ligase II
MARLDTVGGMFGAACRWCGDRDFLVDVRDRYSGARAGRESAALATGLGALGLAPGDRIAFLSRSSVRHAVAYFATQQLGAVTCNLHVRETAPALGAALRWLDARALVFDPDLAGLAAESAAAAGVPLLRISLGDDAGPGIDACYRTLLADHDGTPPPETEAAPDDLAAILLSSGSTGRPKGVMHRHRTLLETAKAGQYIYGHISAYDSTVVMMAPSFAAWTHLVFPYVLARAKIVFGAAFEPAGFLDCVARERITMAPLVPTMWRMVLAADAGGRDLSSLRVAVFSGEPGAKRDIERIRDRICPNVFSIYLATEGGCAAGCLAVTHDLLDRDKPESIGKPVVGSDLRIVDPEGGIDAALAPGEIGEIVLSGASVAAGYWRDPQLTARRFVDGWWRSGDLGVMDSDGDVFLKGRLDNVINSGGIKVHAEEIELALLRHPAVAQAAVIGVADARWGQRIEAHLVVRDPAPDAAALEAFCRDAARLATYKIPKAFHFHAALPTGPTGKLYRRGLRGEG